MYASLKRIYTSTRNVLALDRAVELGWISEEQKEQILLEVGGAE